MSEKPFLPPMAEAGRRFCQLLILSFLTAGTVFAAPGQSQVSQELKGEGGESYSEEVVEEGEGWRLVNARGYASITGKDGAVEPFDRKLIVLQGRAGALNAPIPKDIQEELAAGMETEEDVFSLDVETLDEIVYAQRIGRMTPYLEAIAIPLGEHGKAGDASAKLFDKAKCYQDKEYSKSLNLGQSIPYYNFNLGSGFSGNLAISGNISGSATGVMHYRLEGVKLFGNCIPYAAHFDRARAYGNLQVSYGATVSGTINYGNAWQWPEVVKPHLGSATFMMGPLPVHIGFNLPVDLGLDLSATATGSVSYNTGQVAQGSFDYTCWLSYCQGSHSFTQSSSTNPSLTGSLSGQIKPSPWVNVSVRAYLYNEWTAYAQVGLRGYLHGDLWGYYGNNCGDADQNGVFETVDALTVDLDWQLKVNGAASAFGSSPANFNLWTSPRWHINYWDLIGSEALQPMLVGPAQVNVNASNPYSFKMRPCWPYGDNVNYSITWESGGAPQGQSGAPQSFASLNRSWPTTGAKSLALKAVSDSHGRQINKTTNRTVNVIGGGGGGTYWTSWLNRDAPGGFGDFETRIEFMNEGNNICNGVTPIGVECRTRPGHVLWQSAGENYSCTATQGGVCYNNQQPDGSCFDYEVRFLCP